MAKLISIGQIIDQTVDHYRKHFKELLGITLWILVASAPMLVAELITPVDYGQTAPGFGQLITMLSFNVLGTLSVFIATVWVTVSLILAIDEQASGKTPNIKEIGRRAWKLFLPYVVLSLLIGLIILGLSMLIVPGLVMMSFATFSESMGAALGTSGLILFFLGLIAALYYVIRFSIEFAFTHFILILNRENKPWKNIPSTLRESRSLVKGRWWATFFRFLVPNIVFSLIVFAVNLGIGLGMTVLFAVAVGMISESVLQIGGAVTTMILMGVSALALPLYSLATYYLYDGLTKGR